MMNELTVNWHITEACNFKCTYCFAQWQDKPCKRELFQEPTNVVKLLDQILTLPDILDKHFDSIRLNLVGGETFLYRKQVLHIIEQAKLRGMRLSAITNGSKLDSELNQIIAHNFDIIGFSIDSINPLTNIAIGRKEINNPIDIYSIIKSIIELRKLNPDIQLKINTVVNKLNYYEKLDSFIRLVNPNKWKIFQMLPTYEQSESLRINNEQFQLFLTNHQEYKEIISAEDNDEMTHSYLMIDPNGRFFQNNLGLKGYVYSSEILKVGIQYALSEIKFETEKFLNRYK